MTDVRNVSDIGKQAERALRREMWQTQGRLEAFEFVLDHGADVEQLRAELHAIEERLSDPDLVAGPLAAHTSTRLSREGYLAGLQEAMDIIATTNMDAA